MEIFFILQSGHRCYFLQHKKLLLEGNDSTCNIRQKLMTMYFLRDNLQDNVARVSRLLYAKKNGRNHFTVAESINIGKDFTSDERASQF